MRSFFDKLRTFFRHKFPFFTNILDDHTMKEALDAALTSLWAEGCPMAHPDGRARMIEIGIRRWRSFERCNKCKHPTFDDHVKDLAEGLQDAFEPDRKLVGPLMVHYYCVAEAIATVLAPPQVDA